MGRWSLESGEIVRILPITEGCLKAMRFEHNGRYLISGSKELREG